MTTSPAFRPSGGVIPGTVIAPLRVVTLPPSAFADTWRSRPKAPTKLGIRLVSEDEYIEALKNAAQDAWRDFPDPKDTKQREEIAAFALMRELLVHALCDPHNVDVPFFKETPNAMIRVALRDATIARLFEELEQLSASTNPLIAEATDDEAAELGAAIADPKSLEGVDPDRASRIRRLMTYLRAELDEAGFGNAPPTPTT